MEHCQTPKIMDTLKKAITGQHARMEAMPFIDALTGGRLPVESYVGLLRAMAVIQGTLEHEIASLPPGAVTTVMAGRPSRLTHLRKDLSIFDEEMVPDIHRALAETRKIAERIRLLRVERPDDLLGILYVLEGTTLGNSVHLRDVLNIFGGKTAGKAHYYNGYGKETARYWQDFRDTMNGLSIDQEGCSRIVRVALEFFDQLEALFSALYPLHNDSLVFSAGMLNPEAGNHAVPQDEKEIKAAVAAAEKCRGEFPYFDARYQERGQSFAKSDAAWLASLVDLPADQLFSQVEWLGRVLGNRGVPRITLERQLVLLHEELAAALPAQIDRYQALLDAARQLERERLSFIPQPVFSELAGKFHLAAADDPLGANSRTGALIVSAVCDESAGITGAVESLLAWLGNEKRFSPQWVEAAVMTVARSRDYLKDR